MPTHASRMPLIDALKGLACVMIVWHHLAFYGPMSDAVYTLAPSLIDWLYANGRLAVQVFLVVGGFLAALSLAPDGRARFERPGALILKRYQRLAIPCVAALTLAIVCSAIARQWMTHDSISASPTLGQLLAHLVLAQHLLGIEALSAGIWYVAIDFQLYLIGLALLSVAAVLERRTVPHRKAWAAPLLAVLLTAASLFAFNRDERLDDTGLYFAGSYGLGMLACWASRSPRPAAWILGIVVLAGAALAFDFRIRIAVSLATALLLAWGQSARRAHQWPLPAWLAWLGQSSYSIFLVHFPVSLVVSGAVTRLWPANALAGAGGMLASFALSLGVAAIFHRWIESRPLKPIPELRFHAIFMAVGVAAMLAGV